MSSHAKPKMHKRKLAIISLLCFVAYFTYANKFIPQHHHPAFTDLPHFKPQIVATFPHDPGNFTEGLSFHDGILYESSGRYGHSYIDEIKFDGSKRLNRYALPKNYFGEGIAIFKESLYQLTYRKGAGLIYQLHPLKPKSTFHFNGQGWGLTHDARNLLMTDGSPHIFTLDPKQGISPLFTVKYHGKPVSHLNDLTYYQGYIFVNVWLKPWILIVSAQTGNIVALIDCQQIPEMALQQRNPDAVMNGITILPQSHDLLITGKYWPNYYEIKLPKSLKLP